MADNQNTKRIAKNTMLLYGRMLLLMFVNLYTSRIILNALGVEDYGIYNVVGGVVSMFSILSGSLCSAISRFITFELGKGDMQRLHKLFCTSVNIQLILIAIITILLETVGLWFLNNKMIIPVNRLNAANWVFQFSVITFGVNLWSIPYNATIIAHEKMSAFAYISIFDAIAKLIVAFILTLNPIDRLVYYGLLLLLVGLIQRYLYTSYCKRHFKECKYQLIYDKNITKEMFCFAGWNFLGASSVILRDQGGNIIINLFFGPAINAARGISMTINNAASSFVSNFLTALNPQITKSYASGDFEYMLKLVFRGSILSFYIIFILILPILFTAPYLLKLWLGIVPEHTSNFTCLILLFTLTESLSHTLTTTMLSTGKIRNYQIIVGGCQLLNLPISFVLLYYGYPPEAIFIVSIIVSVLCLYLRLVMLRKLIELSVKQYLIEVCVNVLFVSFVSIIPPLIVSHYFHTEIFFSNIIIIVVCLFSSLITIYSIGCTREEKKYVNKYLSKYIKCKK